MVIEQSSVSLACEGGLRTWLCFTRKIFLVHCSRTACSGCVALGAAIVNLIRPSMLALTIALVAGGFGIVLYNVEMSALAAGLLIFESCASRAVCRVKTKQQRKDRTATATANWRRFR